MFYCVGGEDGRVKRGVSLDLVPRAAERGDVPERGCEHPVGGALAVGRAHTARAQHGKQKGQEKKKWKSTATERGREEEK